MADAPATEQPLVSLGADGNVYLLGSPMPPAQALRVLAALRDLEPELEQRARRGRLGDALSGLGALLHAGSDLPDLGEFTVNDDGRLLVTVADDGLDGVAAAIGAPVTEETDGGGRWRRAERDSIVFRAKPAPAAPPAA